MIVQAKPFYTTGTTVLPNAHHLLRVKNKMINTISYSDLAAIFLHHHPQKKQALQAHKHRRMGKVGTNLSHNFPDKIQSAALKVDRWLKNFLPSKKVQPLSIVGLAIGSGFSKGVEKMFGGEEADREFMDRWVKISLAKSLFSFYRDKLPLDRQNGVSENIRCYLELLSLDTPFDPVQLPNGTRTNRSVALEHIQENVSRIDQHSRRLIAIGKEIGRINEWHPLNPQQEQLDGVLVLMEEVEWTEGQLRRLRKEFFKKSDLIDVDVDLNELANFLNTTLERSSNPKTSTSYIFSSANAKPLFLTKSQEQAASQFQKHYREEVKNFIDKWRLELLSIDGGVLSEGMQGVLDELEHLCDLTIQESLQVPEELMYI